MSAFIVSADHIDALVTFAALANVTAYHNKSRVTVTLKNAEEIGRILLDENVRSVCGIYSDASVDEKNAAASYRFRFFAAARLQPVAILKALDCLDYQCCESDDWADTLAYALLAAIRTHAIQALPGYSAAAWEIDRQRQEA